MIASFFQLLEASRVEYLLISGQASILYGAATFSEDVDIWLEPNPENVQRFVTVLRASGARYYKLTPPLVPSFLERGHGFHFVLPGAPSEVYLDVMGKVPRVESYAHAVNEARYFETDFGRVHTVGIRELVEIKKTQRAEDYPIIGRLVLAEIGGDLGDELDQWFESQASPLRRADRRYWVAIIDELRHARREGLLMAEGTLV
jgi:hypothetical protein